MDLWQKARDLCIDINKIITRDPFARDFGLKDQMNRSSGSVMDNIAEGLTVLSLPGAEASHRRLLRTTNGRERVNKEVKRRTRVASLFPSEASCLRLVSAVLMEISDEWQAGKAYLTFDR